MSGGKIPNAAILVLGMLATPDAVAVLQQLADSTKHNGFRKRIAAALGAAAHSCGLTPSQLVERTVPTGGLDETGTVTLTAGAVTARTSVDGQLKVAPQWQTPGGWAAKPPVGAVTTDVNRVKRAVKELKDLLGAERRRVEGLLATDRSWDVDEWRRYYLDHPVTGRLSRRLIWTFEAGDTRLTGIPAGAGTVRTTTGGTPLPDAATVRLWHPATASTDEVCDWREWLLREEFTQPFKQAFREVYLLTPAERETATYSNRFAADVLRYQQLYALFKERAWAANHLGPYDGGHDGRARHEFPDAGLTIVFEHVQIGAEAGAFRTDLCTTDRVWFFRTADRSRTAPCQSVVIEGGAVRKIDRDSHPAAAIRHMEPVLRGPVERPRRGRADVQRRNDVCRLQVRLLGKRSAGKSRIVSVAVGAALLQERRAIVGERRFRRHDSVVKEIQFDL
ncbi:MAG TPA: DUF4132 domain-containing protein [Kineosporiaceae bacterium]|nr:DUF4132 domain-containing protein [Kineosporiaceae bacterium]